MATVSSSTYIVRGLNDSDGFDISCASLSFLFLNVRVLKRTSRIVRALALIHISTFFVVVIYPSWGKFAVLLTLCFHLGLGPAAS